MLKHIGISILLVVITGSTLLAQRGHHRQLPELTDAQKTQLALSAEQETALASLKAATKADLDALHERTDLDHEARRAAAKAIFANAKEERNKILSEEQQARLKAMRQEQREAHRERMKNVDHQAMRAELREYRKTEIEPVVRAQRAQLDAEISTEDQQRLEEIRATLKAARQAARAERKGQETDQRHADRKGHKRGGHHGKGGHHHPGRNIHRLAEKHPAEFAELEAMVNKYDATITSLLAELEPRHASWRAEQRAIKERYLPEGHPHKGDHAHRGEHAKSESEKAEGRALMKKIGFLLKDADAPANETDNPAPVERITARTYPNPATNATTLAFELPDPMVVAIDIRDENGNLVKTVTQEQLPAGPHELSIDLTNLRNGTYYLTISSERLATPQSVKIVVVK